MATKKGQIYICEICGNKVMVLEAGAGELSCCDEPMRHIEMVNPPEKADQETPTPSSR